MKVTYSTLGIFILLTIAAILFDVFAREKLFLYSLEAIEKFQANRDYLVPSFEFISILCTENVLLPFSIVIYVLFPMNKSFCFITALVLANYFDNIMKIMYGNPRPFWVKESLFKACDGGFGNPSGHSYVSTTAYLSIAHLLIGINKNKNKACRIAINVLIALFFLSVIVSIIVSRVFLGVHSINQVLYGSSLGAATYFFSFFVLTTHNQSAKTFFKSYNNNKSIIIYHLLYTVGIIIAILLYFLIDNSPDSVWVASMNKYCPEVHEFRRYNNDGLFAAFQLFFLFGTHSGMVLTFKMLNVDKKKGKELITRIVNWNKGDAKQLALKVLLLIPFLLILLLFIVIPSDISLLTIFIFKIALPFYLSPFCVFGPFLLLCSRLQLLPEKEEEEEKEEEKSDEQLMEEITHSNDIEDKVSNNSNNNSNKKEELEHLTNNDSINS